MSAIMQSLLLTIATVTVGIGMTLGAVLLLGFTRHRLRGWNIYFALSLAALGFVRFTESATGEVHATIVLATWGNLAIGTVIGVVGVMRLARKDSPTFGRARNPRSDAK